MKKNYLTEHEIKSLLLMDFHAEILNTVRDFFIFCCFTPLSLADLKRLQKKNVENGMWINMTLAKSDVESRIPLLQIPQLIYHKYVWETRYLCIFPIASIHTINHYMRQIGESYNFGKDITFRTAMNTFVYLASLYGVSSETINRLIRNADTNVIKSLLPMSDEKLLDEFAIFDEQSKEWGDLWAKRFNPNYYKLNFKI